MQFMMPNNINSPKAKFCFYYNNRFISTRFLQLVSLYTKGSSLLQ